MVKLNQQVSENGGDAADRAVDKLDLVGKRATIAPKKTKRPGKKIGRAKAAASRGRRPGRKPYPVTTFEEVLRIGKGIMDHGAGHPMQRLTLLKALKLGDSQSTRNLITNSLRYAITQGHQQADEIKLTKLGRIVVDPKSLPRQKAQASFELAVKAIEPFFTLYQRFAGGNLPVPDVMRDVLTGIDDSDRAQCVDIFIANAKYVGLLVTRDSAPRLLTIELLLDELPGSAAVRDVPAVAGVIVDASNGSIPATETAFDEICFFVAPIGEEGSEQRQHSDAVLASFIEPLLKEHGLKIIRADQITKPGMINAQIIDHILHSKLVVADLSFHNPSVFYELCLRHVTGKPTIHLIRDGEKIPFDLDDFRTIKLPVHGVYQLLAKLEISRAEIAQQIRQALADGVTTTHPILAFCPKARFVPEEESPSTT